MCLSTGGFWNLSLHTHVSMRKASSLRLIFSCWKWVSQPRFDSQKLQYPLFMVSIPIETEHALVVVSVRDPFATDSPSPTISNFLFLPKNDFWTFPSDFYCSTYCRLNASNDWWQQKQILKVFDCMS